MRWRMDLAYDGTEYHGWAVQPGLRTVQGVLEEWLPTLLRAEGEVPLTVAGRTDAGVHARSQVCHFDVDDPGAPEVLHRRLARVLPEDITVWRITRAPAGFDARFSAIWRRYCYRITDRAADPLLRHTHTRSRFALDVDAMNTASSILTGLRDFAPFCKPRAGATTIRHLRELRVERTAAGVVEVHLLADAFCHSMVRSLVGALSAVGGGRRNLAWLEDVASSARRHPDVTVMPARGLTLEEVGYPADEQLAQRAARARAVRTLEET